MKLARIRQNRNTIPAVVVSDSEILDCSSIASDWDGSFYENGGVASLQKALAEKKAKLPRLSPQPSDFDSSIPRPGKIVCIGLNYHDHAKEAGMEIPTEPIIFMKATTALSAPNDPIRKPRNSEMLDWEVELGIVIGKRARYLKTEEEALSSIAGYTLVHDVSERDFQLKRGGQWVKGKSHDTFCPTGPWVATSDEIENPGRLALSLSVNGEIKQSESTGSMIFSVSKIVHYLSQYMTLEAGDLIITGTPSGIGGGMNPPQFLEIGDKIELSIEGLGTQTQIVIADR
ncbi:MAG: fumarylacetoacetate hydrolase family protein [Verrucomicrobiota bacterium]